MLIKIHTISLVLAEGVCMFVVPSGSLIFTGSFSPHRGKQELTFTLPKQSAHLFLSTLGGYDKTTS